MLEALESKKEKEAENKRRKQEEQSRLIKTQTFVKPSGTRQKTYPKENIAFKCNYCNGGLTENGIGYICACTDEMINYNIEVAQHNWCCDDGSPCKKYHDKIITRKELDSVSEEDGFVCYESQMLRNWTAFAGFALTKENHQGLHRYITDEQATSILKDIATVKKGKKDEELAQEFFEHFCKINRIDISELPIMEGALQRKYKTR